MTRARELADQHKTLDVDGGTIKLDGDYPTGSENLALGNAALDDGSLSGGSNTAIGSSALTANTTGVSNTATGRVALGANVGGTDNSAFGKDALATNVSGNFNTAIGSNALLVNTASNNTAVGYQAGYHTTTANRLTAIGQYAGFGQATGAENTYIGYGSGPNTVTNASGQYNTGLGVFSLYSNTTASTNTAIGYSALYSNTTASYNTAVGFESGKNLNTTGNTFNTFVGMQSGFNTTTGTKNTYVGSGGSGYGAGYFMTTGSANTIIGAYNGNQDGLDIRTSDENIVLSDGVGKPRGYYYAIGKQWRMHGERDNYFAMFLDHQGTGGLPFGLIIRYPNAAPDNNSAYFLQCSDSSTQRMLVYNDGDVVNHDNSYGAISDVKLKEQITDASSQWDDIKALTVRKYKMKSDVTEKGDSDNLWRLGVVAQEVEAAGMSGLVKESPDRDADNNDLGTTTKEVKYSILYMKAVKALQEAMERIETLEAKVAALEAN